MNETRCENQTDEVITSEQIEYLKSNLELPLKTDGDYLKTDEDYRRLSMLFDEDE